MCEYCGCRDIPLIGRLSEEHYLAVDELGDLRRAIAGGEAAAVADALKRFADELFAHNDAEEAGLFHELAKDDYFAPTVAELVEQHVTFRALVDRIAGGEWGAYTDLEELLRGHIDREENGLFPAAAIAFAGMEWERVAALTPRREPAGA
jgi:hemerythrin-like domain-containing protein